MKNIFLFACVCVLAGSVKAQFIKTYKAIPGCSSAGGNLTFHCISKALRSNNFFIAGMQDSALYVAEITPAGLIVREKLIAVNAPSLLPETMITDNDGNLAIVGEVKNTTYNTSYGFIAKISPALSLIYEKDFYAYSPNVNTLILSDIKENAGFYYVCGTTILPTNSSRNYDVLLMRLDKYTGGLSGTVPSGDIYSGQPGTSSGFDSYDALSLITDDKGTVTGISATGRIGANKNVRPWINQHDPGTLAFIKGQRYILPLTSRTSLYSSSLLRDENNTLTCWLGSLSSNSTYQHIGLISVDNATLNPVFIKQYFVTSPKPQREVWLRRVRKDVLNGGYINEGFWWTRGTDAIGRALPGNLFLLKTDGNGNPLWGRQFKDILVSVYSHNSEFVVDGNYIYAVGYKKDIVTGNYIGALIQLPANNGAMDTACAYKLTIDYKDIDVHVSDSLQKLDMVVQGPSNAYPVNCLQTLDSSSCAGCGDSLKLDAHFELSGQTIGSTTFTSTAFAFNTSPNSQWIVGDATGNTYTNVYTSTPGGIWGTTVGTTFGGYYGSETTSPPDGFFIQGHKYRFTHILSYTNKCGILSSDTTVKSLSLCSGCKTTALNKLTANNTATQKKLQIIAMPNPFTNEFRISGISGKASMQIFTTDGKLVAQYNNISNNQSLGKNLLRGVYVLKIFREDNSSEDVRIIKN